MPSAAVAVGLGGCLPRGCPPEGCLPRGGVSAREGVSARHTPCEQNHRWLWKHYLAVTTLQTIIITLFKDLNGTLYFCLGDATPQNHGLIAGLFRVSLFINLGGGDTDDLWALRREALSTFDDRRTLECGDWVELTIWNGMKWSRQSFFSI